MGDEFHSVKRKNDLIIQGMTPFPMVPPAVLLGHCMRAVLRERKRQRILID